MKVQVEEVSPIQRKLSIEVDPGTVGRALEQAYSTLSRQVKIPGFRPGKVPRRILEQRFRGQVEGEVIQQVVQSAYLDAIREHSVDVVAPPRVTPEGALRPDAPFTFQAVVDVRPKVAPKEFRELPLKRREAEVADLRVEERIEQLRQQLGRLEPVEGREAAQSGDFAIVDFEATIDGKEFPGSRAENMTAEIAPGELVESKIASLEGVRVGESKEIDYAFPPDYPVEEVSGKLAHFKLQLKGLKVRKVPELNDDLARELEGGETLEELRAKVRGDLERAEKSQVDSADREELLTLLLERNPFEVPPAMVDRAVDAMLEGALRNIMRSGVDPQMLNLDFEKLREEMRGRALTEVKGALVLEAIAEADALAVSDEDLEKRMEELAEQSNQALSQVRKAFRTPDARRGLELRLREEKTVEFLKAHAKYS